MRLRTRWPLSSRWCLTGMSTRTWPCYTRSCTRSSPRAASCRTRRSSCGSRSVSTKVRFHENYVICAALTWGNRCCYHDHVPPFVRERVLEHRLHLVHCSYSQRANNGCARDYDLVRASSLVNILVELTSILQASIHGCF